MATTTCDTTLMIENFGGTENALQLDGKGMSASEIQTTLTKAFGQSLGSIGAGLLCCSLTYTALTDALSSIQFGGDCKIKVGPDTNISLPDNYIDDNGLCNTLIFDVGEVNEADIRRLAPVLKAATYILYAPTPMTTEALAKLRMALLPNNFQALPGSRSSQAGNAERTLEAAKKIQKVCVMFTVAAMNASGISSTGGGPDRQPATSVAPTHQSEVCQVSGLQYDRPSMSYYRKGSDLISLDTNKTIVKKVKTVLRKYIDVCIGVYDVQFDDCNDKVLVLTSSILAAFNKELRRR
ncbi:uncharacterized protein LOC142786517 [Rhipicephalus microplus]|uniref:uncharacterized protein LOC142786517 n=1 Tax=Rhipicephalus microplus TaxID=6941 RepID=UPI003F6CDC9E